MVGRVSESGNVAHSATLDDRRKDGGTNFILTIKEQETRLTLREHDDDDYRVLRKIFKPKREEEGT